MKVFLTGHLGYVGKVLLQKLLEQNFEVVGCDVGYYPQSFDDKEITPQSFLKKDIRDVTKEDLLGCNAICHLAGLSNDPIGEINPELTNEINYLSTIRLAKLSKEVGVERFIFSSSCSAYGLNEDVVNEESQLAPQTAYAKSKVNSEQGLAKLKSINFSPVMLRNATVYGISPNLRLDLVVNNLIGSALSTGKIKLTSDGTAWRPLLHVEDMASAFVRCLKASKNEVSGKFFNVGSNQGNHKVIQIAEKIAQKIPDSEIEIVNKNNKDNRSYRVNFDKIGEEIGFKTKWNLDDGIKQIYDAMKDKCLSVEYFSDKSFHRLKYLKWLLEQGTIDQDLRFKN